MKSGLSYKYLTLRQYCAANDKTNYRYKKPKLVAILKQPNVWQALLKQNKANRKPFFFFISHQSIRALFETSRGLMFAFSVISVNVFTFFNHSRRTVYPVTLGNHVKWYQRWYHICKRAYKGKPTITNLILRSFRQFHYLKYFHCPLLLTCTVYSVKTLLI